MENPISTADEQFNKLKAFRQKSYASLGQAQDALFELCDAVLLTAAVTSFAELSCAPVFRRRWSSLYEALQDGRPDRGALLGVYAEHIPTSPRPVLAGDPSAWSRVSAYTLAERTVEHQPTKVPGNRPITVGQGYSTLVWVPELAGSWALPLLHERIPAESNPFTLAHDQLKTVCQVLTARPITLFDAEYGCASFVKQTADVPADKIVRLRGNLCLWGQAPAYAGRGRPRVHGDKFKLRDPQSWGEPSHSLTIDDPELGEVRVSLWSDKHFRQAKEQPLRVVRIHRPQAKNSRRDPQDLWLAWVGETPPPLCAWWRLYLRRFAVDHWYRFAKQRLFWTLPKLSTPQQADRWSDVMPLMTWQLWLARSGVVDTPRPWQKPQKHLTPGRVCQSLAAVFAAIGTPAKVPKPRGKSPGWPKGRKRKPRQRFAIVKKAKKRAKKTA